MPILLFPHVNTTSRPTIFSTLLLYPIATLRLNWTRSCVDFMDVTLGVHGGTCPGADPGFPEGGGQDIHKHPPPLDLVRVTSSALKKIEKYPHSKTFTSTPPLDLVRVTSSALKKN